MAKDFLTPKELSEHFDLSISRVQDLLTRKKDKVLAHRYEDRIAYSLDDFSFFLAEEEKNKEKQAGQKTDLNLSALEDRLSSLIKNSLEQFTREHTQIAKKNAEEIARLNDEIKVLNIYLAQARFFASSESFETSAPAEKRAWEENRSNDASPPTPAREPLPPAESEQRPVLKIETAPAKVLASKPKELDFDHWLNENLPQPLPVLLSKVKDYPLSFSYEQKLNLMRFSSWLSSLLEIQCNDSSDYQRFYESFISTLDPESGKRIIDLIFDPFSYDIKSLSIDPIVREAKPNLFKTQGLIFNIMKSKELAPLLSFLLIHKNLDYVEMDFYDFCEIVSVRIDLGL